MKGKGQRKRQDWWLRLSFCKRPAGWLGKRGKNSNSWEAAGDKSDRLDRTQDQGPNGIVR